MLFDQNLEPSCSYCKYGNIIGEEEIICLKKGALTLPNSCRKFTYDPLKRIPAQKMLLDLDEFQKDDFEL